jgi:hypothetical protein
MAIWCVYFCGMQWRVIGQLCDTLRHAPQPVCSLDPDRPLASLRDQLRCTWRSVSAPCGDAAELSAVIIDNRSCHSAPSCFERGIDGGKKIGGGRSPR